MYDYLKFILLLILQIPAICISIIIFIYFIFHRNIRSKSENHVWLVLLTINFLQLIVDLPMPLSFYNLGKVWPVNDSYCVWWTWYEYSLNAVSLILMSWASVQRYFFIFYPRFLLGSSWKKWIYHYIPIILCISFPLLWYMIQVVISPSCINVWDFNAVLCGVPCFLNANNGIYGICDLLLNSTIPLTVIIVSNLRLILRVIYEKMGRHQVIHWRQHRKMTLQLWFISSLYLAAWLPFTIIQLIQTIAIPTFMNDQLEIILFLFYFVPVLLPVICLSVFPNTLYSILNTFKRQIRNRIGII